MKRLSYRLASAVTALCLSTLAPAAAAQETAAYSTLSGFTWELFDLNPEDGIAPSLTYTESIESWLSASGAIPAPDYQRRTDFGKTSASSAAYHIETSTASGVLQSSARVTGTGPAPLFTGASNNYTFNFTLSPSTGVRFRAFAHAEAVANQYGSSYSTAGLVAEIDYPSPRLWTRDTTVYDQILAEDQIVDATLFGYLESDGQVRTGNVRLSTFSNAIFQGVSPVPEPQTYLMLLAGLALIGARRKAGRR